MRFLFARRSEIHGGDSLPQPSCAASQSFVGTGQVQRLLFRGDWRVGPPVHRDPTPRKNFMLLEPRHDAWTLGDEPCAFCRVFARYDYYGVH